MSSPNQPGNSQIPTQFRAISRNNSNASTASSSNRCDISSISTTNSVASSRNHLNKSQLIDHKQILATCGSSTPIRSFQRATISSVVKTRAFDNSPVLQSLLTAVSPTGQSSVSNSQTPSPLSGQSLSRSRSLRMSGGPHRYKRSNYTSDYRNNTGTPDICSFNSGDTLNCLNESSVKLTELNNEKYDLKESLEFLECERQVLMDTTHELKETLHNERTQWRKEIDDLRKQLTDTIAAKIKAESQIVQNEVEMNDMKIRLEKVNEHLAFKDRHLQMLNKNLEKLESENLDMVGLNQQLKRMLTEKLKYNGVSTNGSDDDPQKISDCESIVTAMARLRLELNEKDKMIEKLTNDRDLNNPKSMINSCHEIDILNKFLNDTVECIKRWPDELASSSYVQDLMKSLLEANKIPNNEKDLAFRFDNIHI